MNAVLLMKVLDLVEIGFRASEIRDRIVGKTDDEVSDELDTMLAEADKKAQDAINDAR